MEREELLTILEKQGPSPELLDALESLPCCEICGPYDRCTGHWEPEDQYEERMAQQNAYYREYP